MLIPIFYVSVPIFTSFVRHVRHVRHFFLGQLHKWRTLQTFKLSLVPISTSVHPFLRRLVRHYVLVLGQNGEHGERGEQNDFDKHTVSKKRN